MDMTKEILGRTVSSYQIHGEERNVNGNWIGADLLLEVPPVGRFLVNVVTKNNFLNEGINRVLGDVGQPEQLLKTEEQDSGIERPPFVLNDLEITDELLVRKFGNRIIEADLAASLWYEGPLDQNADHVSKPV